MSRKYRVRCEFRFWNDLCVHILKWTVLIFITFGLAALVYPYYFVKFMASHITIMEESEYRIRENENILTREERKRLKADRKREREEKIKIMQYEFTDMEPPSEPADSTQDNTRVKRPLPK